MHVWLEEMLEFQKLCNVFVCDKNWPFVILWEIPNVFMHYLPDKKPLRPYVPGYGSDWLAEIIVNHGLDLTNKFGSFFFSYQNDQWEASELCPIFVIIIGTIQVFSNPLCIVFLNWQTNTLKYSYWRFWCGSQPYTMPFSSFWRRELHHCTAFFIDSTRLTLVCCTEDKIWNKQSACAKLIISNVHNFYPSHPVFSESYLINFRK